MNIRNKLTIGAAAMSLIAFSINIDEPLYLVQSLATFCLILLTEGRRSTFFFCLSTFFILGNWLKVSIHNIFDYRYIEPIGGFSFTTTELNDFYTFSTVITIALIFNIVMFNIFSSKRSTKIRATRFRRKPKIHYTIAIVIIILIQLLNWQFGFYRIGVERELNLPLGLDPLATSTVFLGLPIFLAIQATYDVEKNRSLTVRNLFIISFVSIIAAATTYSRAMVILIMLPIMYGAFCQAKDRYNPKMSLKPYLVFTLLILIISTAIVSIIRIKVYYNSGAFDSGLFYRYFLESLGLVVDRWIGAESLMTAVSSNQSIELFLQVLFEDPNNGVYSTYQVLSSSRYIELVGKTFLTLPGFFALLAFSGSYLVIFAGVTLVCLIGFSIEGILNRNFKGFLPLRNFVTLGLAYHFCQMSFPYLFIPYVVQLFMFLLIAKTYIVNRQR